MGALLAIRAEFYPEAGLSILDRRVRRAMPRSLAARERLFFVSRKASLTMMPGTFPLRFAAKASGRPQ